MKYKTTPLLKHPYMYNIKKQTSRWVVTIITDFDLHHYKFVAPLVINSLQSGQFWVRSTAPVHDSL